MTAGAATAVIGTDEFGDWFWSLSPEHMSATSHVIDKLEAMGLALDYPHSSAIEGTDLPLRELRPSAGKSPIRVFYIFDPKRDAVLLIGGDKSNDKRFYDRMISRATHIWAQYKLEQGL